VSTRGSVHHGNDLTILRRRAPAGGVSRPTASAARETRRACWDSPERSLALPR